MRLKCGTKNGLQTFRRTISLGVSYFLWSGLSDVHNPLQPVWFLSVAADELDKSFSIRCGLETGREEK